MDTHRMAFEQWWAMYAGGSQFGPLESKESAWAVWKHLKGLDTANQQQRQHQDILCGTLAGFGTAKNGGQK